MNNGVWISWLYLVACAGCHAEGNGLATDASSIEPGDAQVVTDAALESSTGNNIQDGDGGARVRDAVSPEQAEAGLDAQLPEAGEPVDAVVADRASLDAQETGADIEVVVTTARLLDRWPHQVARGQAVLLYGQDLDKVTRVRLNQTALTPAYADQDKLVLVIPADISTGVQTLTLGNGHPGLELDIETDTSVSPVARPRAPVIPRGYPKGAFPPVSDQWRGECVSPNVPAAERYYFERLGADAGVFNFGGELEFSSGLREPVDASYSTQDSLLRFMFPTLNEGRYVGLMSTTEREYLVRMVLFPERAGEQLVLLGCLQELAQEAGVLCPLAGDPLSGVLADTPTECVH